jgi:hypothetical protein
MIGLNVTTTKFIPTINAIELESATKNGTTHREFGTRHFAALHGGAPSCAAAGLVQCEKKRAPVYPEPVSHQTTTQATKWQ